MEIIVVIVAIVFFLVDSSKKTSNKKIVAYDSQTGKPIYDEKYIRVGYDSNNGRPIYTKEHKIIGYDEKTGKPIYDEKAKIIGYDNQTGYPIFEGEEEILKKFEPIKENYDNKEKQSRLSNSLLITIGSLLVLIASIVFLASSWDTISNVFKVFILFGLQMIFLLFSNICNNSLNIPKMGRVFKYLVFVFIPIIMLSFSCFGLVGKYFSINGLGWQLFFCGTFIVTDIFYKLYAKAKNDFNLKRMSLIAELFAIIFISDILQNFSVTLLLLIVHNIIIYILLQGNYLEKEIYQKINDILSYVYIAIASINILSNISIINNISMFIYTIYFFYRYNHNETKEKSYLLFIFFYCYASALRIVNVVDIPTYFITIFSLIPIILLTNTMKNEELKKITRIFILSISIITILASLYNFEKNIYYVLTFISSFVLYIILFNISKKSVYKILAYLSFLSIFVSICFITDYIELSKYIILIMVILIYSFEIIFENLKDKTSKILIIVLLCLESFILANSYSVLLPFIILYLYTKIEKNDDSIIIIPMFCNLSILNLETDISCIISYLLIATYTCLSLLKKKINVYSIMSLITFTVLSFNFEIPSIMYWIIILLWSLAHIIINKTEENKFYKTIITISMLGLYFDLMINTFDVRYISIYLLGLYISTIILTKYIYREYNNIEVFEILGSIFIGLFGIIFINDIVDALILITIALILSIMSFKNKWKCFFHTSLISMIMFIVILALRFWETIPWYIYILIIGLALIIYAMYDENKKRKK